MARKLPDSLEGLPQDGDLYKQLMKLGKLAFEGIIRNEVIFKELPEGCSALDLLDTKSKQYGWKTDVTYNFLHLTLQEYLGAFYISQLPASKQRELFVENCRLDNLNEVWRFVAGLTKMSAIGWNGFRWKEPDASIDRLSVECDYGMEDIVESELSKDYLGLRRGYIAAGGVTCISPSIVQYLYEAQDARSCASVFNQSKVEYRGQGCSNLFDAYVVGYCVSLCRNHWKVDLSYNGLGPDVMEMLLEGLKSVNHGGGFIDELILVHNPIKDEGIKYFCQLPNLILENITKLILSDCGLGQTGFDFLADIVPLLYRLETLSISHNAGGNGSTVKLLRALVKHQKIEVLVMADTEIGIDDIIALSEVVQSAGHLTELQVGSGSNMSPECVQQLVKMALSPSSLTTLGVWVPSSVSPLDYIETISDNLIYLW